MLSAICAFLRGCKNRLARHQHGGIRISIEKEKRQPLRLVHALIVQVDDKFLKV
jgi:hypothetical protein